MLIYLDSTVMEDVSKPRKCSVLVALVKKFNLFSDNILSLRTCILVKVHNKTWILYIFCKGRAERHS